MAWALGAAGQPVSGTGAPALIVLDGSARSRDASQAALVWSGPDGGASLEKAVKRTIAFRAPAPGSIQQLGPGKSLWLKLRLQKSAAAQHEWVLEFPMPVLDAVTVYQLTASGSWKSQMAGDTVSVTSWPEPGRHPFFRLDLPDGAPRDVYVRIRHSIPLSLPVRLVTVPEHEQRVQMEYLGLGMAFGALALLIAACVARACVLRDRDYAWYSAYALLSMLAVGALTGVAAHVLWPRAGAWTDGAPGCLALLSGAVALLIVRRLTAVVTRKRWLGTALHVLGWAGFALAIAYFLIERPLGVALLAIYMLAVAGLSLSAATLAWRRGDIVGRWIMMGALPLTLAVTAALARALGWLEASWLSEYALVAALTFNLPMLLGALNSRSRERRGAQLRQLALSSQDALTGLLNGKAFRARLAQALRRYQRTGESAAVAVIELANHEWIKSSRGAEAAEECLLRSVIKVRRLVRDVDTTGRIGEARFGLIVEGVSSRAVVSALGSRLVASGLMADPDSPGDAELRFHVAAVLLNECAAANEADLTRLLAGTLGRMSPRTHRPFRFVDPLEAQLGDSSGGLDDAPQPQAEQPA